MLSIGGHTLPEKSGTLLNAATATGPGAPLALGSLMSRHAATLTWGGTVPTSMTIALEGSNDGTNYYALATVVMTASPTMFSAVDMPMKYLRGNYISKVGGDGTTAITMTSVSGGN